MTKKTLLLNKSYAPIRTCGARSAICKLFANAATALVIGQDGSYKEFDWDKWFERSQNETLWPKETRWIMSSSGPVAIPTILRCTKYDRVPRVKVRASRHAIFERDDHRCYICGKQFKEDELTVDHMIPKSKGGGWTWDNLITCCRKDNNRKGDKTLREMGIKPVFLPRVPIAANLLFAGDGPEEWKMFGV